MGRRLSVAETRDPMLGRLENITVRDAILLHFAKMNKFI